MAPRDRGKSAGGIAPVGTASRRAWALAPLGLSQQAFASAYRIPLATLKGWEQGRRQPDATASAYLSVIAGLPDAARDVLRGSFEP